MLGKAWICTASKILTGTDCFAICFPSFYFSVDLRWEWGSGNLGGRVDLQRGPGDMEPCFPFGGGASGQGDAQREHGQPYLDDGVWREGGGR